MTDHPQDVCVVIAAMNAAATIGRAVASALAERRVAEVLVVDDGSIDETPAAARFVDDGSGRLRVIELPVNGGPSAARNRAFAESRAPYLAILDADDFILPGRFDRLMAIAGWDLIADDIVFVREDVAGDFDPAGVRRGSGVVEVLDLAGFVRRNIPAGPVQRGELGFIKPVMRRAFLEQAGLAYDETLRLAEDYALYVRALAAGASFLLTHSCGYVAIERAGSLSGRHGTADLAALVAEDEALARLPGLDREARGALAAHRLHTQRKLDHRLFLDRRREGTTFGAMTGFGPAALARIAADVARDKLAARRPAPADAGPRYLLG
ncbi:glycosyltransferase [Sphingomonas naphthae]|uniref:Glycosyltransferase n=1 Tax=Sphingomonas naphthae TaxID=1813468 RepID=A0ABY7TFH3_9SPHN|nr:glycosyltransferase [Sphingomonas naphthae]WCT71885.1 glycosyltransferase [Sphingomonas naphthae]